MNTVNQCSVTRNFENRDLKKSLKQYKKHPHFEHAQPEKNFVNNRSGKQPVSILKSNGKLVARGITVQTFKAQP